MYGLVFITKNNVFTYYVVIFNNFKLLLYFVRSFTSTRILRVRPLCKSPDLINSSNPVQFSITWSSPGDSENHELFQIFGSASQLNIAQTDTKSNLPMLLKYIQIYSTLWDRRKKNNHPHLCVGKIPFLWNTPKKYFS